MNQKQKLFDKFEFITGTKEYVVNNHTYHVKAMPVGMLYDYLNEPVNFFLPMDGDYTQVARNFISIKTQDGGLVSMLEFTKKWLPRLLEYQGEPAGYDLIAAHKWTRQDFGDFLTLAMELSLSFGDNQTGEVKENETEIQVNFFDIIALLLSFGISKDEILHGYSAPLLFRLYPELLKMKAESSFSMFGGMMGFGAPGGEQHTTYGKDGKITRKQYEDFAHF